MPKRRCHFCLAVLPVFLLAIAVSGFRHPFYVSICQIDHNPEVKSLEITFKIFTDDLERALEAQGTGKLYLGDARESPEADRYLHNYLKNQVEIVVNGDTTAFRYVGKEVEMDVTWCYVEIAQVTEVKKIAVTNRILLEIYEEQTNLVHVKAGDRQKSMLLRKGKVTDTVEF